MRIHYIQILWFVIAYRFKRVIGTFLSVSPVKCNYCKFRSFMNKYDSRGYQNEETLLQIRFAIHPEYSKDDAKERLLAYIKTFHFAAVLPVQPLTYLPNEDKDGVDIQFLRKKTDVKSGNEGGIRFYIAESADRYIELIAKRNSMGQTIPKIFSERLIVTALASGIQGKEEDRFGPAPSAVLTLQSIYHKWM